MLTKKKFATRQQKDIFLFLKILNWLEFYEENNKLCASVKMLTARAWSANKIFKNSYIVLRLKKS